MASLDSFKCAKTLKVGDKRYVIYSLAEAEKNGLDGISALPYSMKVMLENLLRFEDGRTVTKADILAMRDWLTHKGKVDKEIGFLPARVLMQDFTGVPAVVDLAAMRDGMTTLGGDPSKINPLVPVDLVIDHYFLVLEKLGERVEGIEDTVLTRAGRETLGEIHRLKRDLLFMRRAVWPVKETITSLRHSDSPLLARATQPFLRDLQDHIEQVIEGLDAYHALLSDTLSVYLSTQSNRTNTIMKVLAVFSAVFMPLTFITGIFGMNFRHMPALDWEWGFTATLAAMLSLGALMAFFFVRRRWL
jgi:hypothetical protein